MKNKWIRQVIFPLVAAIIWGTAFVFQSEGAEYVGPFTFNTMRCAMATVFLGLILFGRDVLAKRKPRADAQPAEPREVKTLLLGGGLCGAVLACASNLQQLGLGATSPGKAAFITALYVVLVPVAALFFGKRARPIVWIGVALAVAGLYFLCMNGTDFGSIYFGDVLALICAIAFAVHILLIERFAPNADGLKLSCVQFVVGGVIGCILMFIFEEPSWSALFEAAIPLLYAGVMSCGVAYTLQIIGQKYTESAMASLIMCMESVFAVIASAILLSDVMSARETIGCIIMFVAIALPNVYAMIQNRK